MEKYDVKKIMHVRRLGTSVYGNPYFELIFDDFTSARTKIDASINYEVQNKDLWETDVAIFTTKAGRVWNVVPVDKLPDDTKYRWIVYLHQPMGGFEVRRVTSLDEAKDALYQWSRDVYVYEQASATLYRYSKEDWAEAEEYIEIGCPFDYPSKVMEFGPKGGIKVENA
jgi:hypothetical protein